MEISVGTYSSVCYWVEVHYWECPLIECPLHIYTVVIKSQPEFYVDSCCMDRGKVAHASTQKFFILEILIVKLKFQQFTSKNSYIIIQSKLIITPHNQGRLIVASNDLTALDPLY